MNKFKINRRVATVHLGRIVHGNIVRIDLHQWVGEDGRTHTSVAYMIQITEEQGPHNLNRKEVEVAATRKELIKRL